MHYTRRLFLALGLLACALIVLFSLGQRSQGQSSSTSARYLPRYASAPNCTRVFQIYGDTTSGKVRFCSVVGTPGTWNDLAAGSFVAPGAITSSGLTQATNKLLGRGTASTGAIEEITLGTNLSLTGTTLNATGGATINSTNGVIPYRSSSTAFSDSPLSVSGGNVSSSGQLLGTGDTASAPGLSFAAFPNTGWYTTNGLNLFATINGTARIFIDAGNGNLSWGVDGAFRLGASFDLRFAHAGAGVASITDGSGNLGQLNLATVKPTGVTFANLPASPATGMIATVNDSNTNTWGATIAGGGSNVVLAFYNGSNWTVAAK